MVALLWKNLIAAESTLRLTFWAILGLGYFLLAFGLRTFAPASLGAIVLGALPLGLAPMILLWGPGVTRFDLRQDLRVADLLKTYPLPGWQLVLGEALAPALVLTLLQYVFIVLCVVLFPETHHVVPFSTRLALGLGSVIIAPALNLFALLLHNGTVVLFPAWLRTGPRGAQGFEAMGHQMLLMIGQVVALALALIMPAGAFALVFVLVRHWFVLLVWLPLASVAASAILAAEAFAGIFMLGTLFERLDVSDEMMG